MRTIFIAALLTASPAFAQSDADVLLDQLGEKPAQHKVENRKIVSNLSEFQGGDAFQQQLWIQIQAAHKVPFDVKQWAQLVLDGEFAHAAHLWTAIQLQIPGPLRQEAEATQLYLLWKLGLNQTFFDQWVRGLADKNFAESNPEQTLETIVTPGLDAWLLRSGVVVNQKAQTVLDTMAATDAFIVTLKAYANMRNPKAAAELLGTLPADNKLTRFLAQTVIYEDVRKGDLKSAARLLKNVIEPVIESSKDMELMAHHDISIARILYQAGQMKAAAQFYRKVPNRSPSYLDAREELSWVYLRTNDMSDLRGEIKALSSPVFKDRFQPETFLLRAVSNLKMCFYDLLDKDLTDFTRSNASWAKKIDQAMAAKSPPAPEQPDVYSQMSARAVQNLEAEIAKVNDLGEKSIGAVLPAVGQQKHWKDYRGGLQAAVEDARKRQSDDYTRQWKNQRSALVEAIRKMRFVKVEYESQVRQLAGSDTIDKTKFVASNATSIPAAGVTKDVSDQLNFPATSEVWSDELFKLRSAAQAQCLKKAGGT
jgi:hypothetical protein